MMTRKLYRMPEQGMISGVCAGISHSFDVPLIVVRLLAVLALFCGLFVFTILAYAILAFMLKPLEYDVNDGNREMSSRQTFILMENEFANNEKRLRELERYVTSDTYRTRSKFSQL